MEKLFEPVEGRNEEIIETVMCAPEVVSLPDNIQFDIRLCVEEVEENILCYSGTTWVKVWIDKKDDSIEVGFCDGGVQFDPLAKPDPNINSSLEDRQVGGLGIFICKQMMDELTYQFKNGVNVFVMKKNL